MAAKTAGLAGPAVSGVAVMDTVMSKVYATILGAQAPLAAATKAGAAATKAGAAATKAGGPNLGGLALISVAALATVGIAVRQQSQLSEQTQPATGTQPSAGSASSNGASAVSGKAPHAAEARAWIEAWRAKQK